MFALEGLGLDFFRTKWASFHGWEFFLVERRSDGLISHSLRRTKSWKLPSKIVQLVICRGKPPFKLVLQSSFATIDVSV